MDKELGGPFMPSPTRGVPRRPDNWIEHLKQAADLRIQAELGALTRAVTRLVYLLMLMVVVSGARACL